MHQVYLNGLEDTFDVEPLLDHRIDHMDILDDLFQCLAHIRGGTFAATLHIRLATAYCLHPVFPSRTATLLFRVVRLEYDGVSSHFPDVTD